MTTRTPDVTPTGQTGIHTGAPARSGAGDLAIRASTAATVVGIGAIAAVVSFRHALGVVRQHGETGFTSYLTPLTVDGLVFTASMVLLDAARTGHKPPRLARTALGLGIAATVAVNVLHGLTNGPIGAVVAAWPAVTLVLVVELLMGMIHRRRTRNPQPVPDALPEGDAFAAYLSSLPPLVEDGHLSTANLHPVPAFETPGPMAEVHHLPVGTDPVHVRAVRVFADDLAVGKVPSIRRIKSALRCGQSKASQVRDYLTSRIVSDVTSEPEPATESDGEVLEPLS